MQTRIIAFTIALCATVTFAAAQCELNNCSPTGVCPPTGNAMGQSNYQRSPYSAPAPQPLPTPLQPGITPYHTEPPLSLPPEVGAGPAVDATLGEKSYIAVDDQYIYVLQGDEVVKLDKSNLKMVAKTKLPHK